MHGQKNCILMVKVEQLYFMTNDLIFLLSFTHSFILFTSYYSRRQGLCVDITHLI